MKWKTVLCIMLLLVWLTGCAQAAKPQTDQELRGMGMIVMYELAPNASEKKGLRAITDAGNRLFGSASLNHKNGGVSAIGGGSKMAFPRWVRITWRDGVDAENGLYWTTGKVIGDYTVEILSLIPEEIFTYANAARGRAIVLRFRIKDDGVLLAWDVQESSPNGQSWIYKMHGGDFLDPTIYNGKVIDPGWVK